MGDRNSAREEIEKKSDIRLRAAVTSTLCLRHYSLGETIAFDNAALMKSASDYLMFVTSFNLKSDDWPLTLNNAGSTRDQVPQGSRSQVLDINMRADRCLIRFKHRRHDLAQLVQETR